MKSKNAGTRKLESVTAVTKNNISPTSSKSRQHVYSRRQTPNGIVYVCILDSLDGTGKCFKEFRNILMVQHHLALVHHVRAGPDYHTGNHSGKKQAKHI